MLGKNRLKSTIMNLFLNILNLMLVWISSDGAEQQAVRNKNHECGKILKLTTISIKGEMRWNKGGGEEREEGEKKPHKTRQELRKKLWTISILGSKEEEI